MASEGVRLSGRPGTPSPPIPCRGPTATPNSKIFNASGAPAGYRKGPADPPFVSFLHTRETVPAGSDPVSGNSETSFCFITIGDVGTGRNHGSVKAPDSPIREGIRRYGWCIMVRTMMTRACDRKIDTLPGIGG